MMKILINKGNICIIENDTEIYCISYETLIATYNKLTNSYTIVNTYTANGEEIKLSRTSRKHQNLFKREYIPTDAQQV